MRRVLIHLSISISDSLFLGAVSALFTVGGFLGALSTIPLGDLLGRRRIIFLGSALVVIGGVLMSSAYSLAQLIVARLVQGCGTGAITATVPVWQSELSGSAHRGSHVVTEGLFIAAGIAASQWIDLGFFFIAHLLYHGECLSSFKSPCQFWS